MHQSTTSEARRIAEHLLVETGAALQAGDLAAFARCFRLPQTVASFAGQRRLETLEDVGEVFDKVRSSFINDGVARVVRYVEEADFDGDDRIVSNHVTTIHLRDGSMREPYPTLSVLHRTAEGWKVGDSQYALTEDTEHALAFATEHRSRGEAGDIAIFQAVLDEITAAFLTNDVDRLHKSVRLPVLFHTQRGAQVMKTEDELRRDLALYQAEFELHRVTDIVRRTIAVHPLGQSRLVGQYNTHILSGTTQVVPSFESTMHLELGDDGAWRASSVLNAMGHLNWSDQAPGRDAAAQPFIFVTERRPQAGHTTTTGDNHV
ncbi:hypothetical protein KUH32_01625 [Thalassococcus sp. CAU 1522]|uniref:SnoaL-like domain-containing protein n=1 Tax=Thalassococcus arenae TaxID=2851652 RepID=A0ABS6N365_9RHOB|nr:hypothetical protein [Thalassococcus arenae]MBV2358462.1 hypothetical protein [Thalassococcus arenae]